MRILEMMATPQGIGGGIVGVLLGLIIGVPVAVGIADAVQPQIMVTSTGATKFLFSLVFAIFKVPLPIVGCGILGICVGSSMVKE